jgi:acyl-CoA synthetase (AMP-forming)/AMP-acid ligase II
MLVQHFLENSASRLPDKVALICDGKRLTYSEINRQADQLASALANLGIKRQDRVVIFMDNSAESVASLFGILKAGAIFIMVNATMKAKKLRYILKDSDAKALITHSNKARIIHEALDGVSPLEHILWVGSAPKLPPSGSAGIRFHAWNDLVDLSPSSVVNGPLSEYQPSAVSLQSPGSPPLDPGSSVSRAPCAGGIDIDLAAIIYTSGSTGEPKGVMSAHYNMVAAAKSITRYLGNTEDDILLNVLPLSFDYGLYQVLMAFLFGGTVVLEKSFLYPYRILEKVVEEKVTGFPLVPTMAALLLQMEDLSKFDFSRLRYMSNTAAALPVAYIRKLQSLFPHVRIFSMYGLTECKRVSYLPPDQLDKRPDSVGIPIPNEEVFVVDESGNEVPPGEVGELVIRGSNVMQGYWNAPEETARRYRPGRYRGETLLYSGDLFRRDEEGYLYFVARKDDMIKTKGERVSPKEIESALCELEGVAEAAVIGVPDEIFGQAIKAFVVQKKGAGLVDKDVLSYCTKSLEPFMVPKYVEFIESFPKSPSGKIDKKELK